MRMALAALAAAMCVFGLPAAAQSGAALTLDAAFARVLARHPDLARFRYQREVGKAAIAEAAQSPALNVEFELENAFGTGAASGFDGAEATLSLASVLEPAAKRDARRTVANAQMRMVTFDEEARRLDLLAEVARRYLDLLAAQSQAQLAEAELAQRERVVDAAAQRVRAGASPESVRLTAEASVARAALARTRTKSEVHAAAQRLAVMWNDRAPDFERAAGDPLVLPAVPSLENLTAVLDRNPDLRRFADESRLREARVRLAESARMRDIQWRAGARRLEETDDWAAVLGVSVPIGAARHVPRARAAEAELAVLALERESEAISLYATLTDAHARLSAASTEVAMARNDVLPRLERAEAAAERAYRAGALSYLEWAQVHAQTMETRREQLLTAIDAHRALIELQRLTGDPFTAANSQEKQP